MTGDRTGQITNPFIVSGVFCRRGSCRNRRNKKHSGQPEGYERSILLTGTAYMRLLLLARSMVQVYNLPRSSSSSKLTVPGVGDKRRSGARAFNPLAVGRSFCQGDSCRNCLNKHHRQQTQGYNLLFSHFGMTYLPHFINPGCIVISQEPQDSPFCR